jgi:predicted ATPase
MLTELTIRNFKAIRNMPIKFTPLTVLIGGNSCGKSTVLQALDFLRSAATRDIPEYLRERGWDFADLKSQCDGGANQPIEFISEWTLPVKKSQKDIEWTLSIDFKDKWIIKEKIIEIIDNNTKKELLNRDKGKNLITLENPYGIEQGSFPLSGMHFESSLLKLMDDAFLDSDGDGKKLLCLKDYLASVNNFEVLSPEKMRSGNKVPKSGNIGVGGETLADCIDWMKKEDKEKLDKLVSDIIGLNVEIKTFDLGNKVEMFVHEQTSQDLFKINARHLSDGLLRIIAYVAISLEKQVIVYTQPSLEGENVNLTTNGETFLSNRLIRQPRI